MASLTLSQRLDAAFGSPFSVDFGELHGLLEAILQHLGLQDLPLRAVGRSPTPLLGSTHSLQCPSKEGEEGGGPGTELEPLVSVKDALAGTASSLQVTSVGQLEKDASESSVSKALLEIDAMKAAQERMEAEIQQLQKALGLQGSGGPSGPVKSPRAEEDTQRGTRSAPGTQTGNLGTQPGSPVTQTPTLGAELGSPNTQTLTLGAQPGSPGTQAPTLGTQPGSPSTSTRTPGAEPGSPGTQSPTLGKQPGSPGTQAPTLGTQPGSPGTSTLTPGAEPGSPGTQSPTLGKQPGSPGTSTPTQGVKPGTHGTQTPTLGAEPGFPGTQSPTLGKQPGSPGTQAPTLGAEPGFTGTQSPTLGKQPGSALTQIPTQGAEPGSPTTQSATLEAESGSSCSQTSIAGTQAQVFQEIGQLGILYANLKEQVAQLAASKAERSELEKLHQLFAEGGQKNITSALSDLQSQLSSLQSPASDLQGETGKIMQLEDALGKLQVPGAEGKEDIRLLLQELKQELGEQQQKSQATLEQLVDKSADQLQAQLDELRVVVESLRQAEGHAAHPICSKDTGTQVEQLLQHYEKLQEQVESVMCQQAAGKVARQRHEKSQQEEKLLKHMQASIAQLQAQHEWLGSAVRDLLDGSEKKQRDIEALFLFLERLEEKKGEKEVLEVDSKATKSTAGSQVSRSQFEASMERLMEIIEKIQSQGMAQEQGLQQLQQQLREVMDSKLDRPELAPVQSQLEHCKNTLKQLKDIVPQTGTADGAAGMKYPQAHCHCLSCDQPLAVTAPGPVSNTRHRGWDGGDGCWRCPAVWDTGAWVSSPAKRPAKPPGQPCLAAGAQ
ncbi:glutamine-rich protein 2-like [Cuculus canorus]|uniref:glutamine-rich protein 2-like n=1 Tax=Cuculus canorus TaxID=55661 RepID=UPI0023AB137F|nr:glutamine-rich protein 2-like [Cuculus canorus]